MPQAPGPRACILSLHLATESACTLPIRPHQEPRKWMFDHWPSGISQIQILLRGVSMNMSFDSGKGDLALVGYDAADRV